MVPAPSCVQGWGFQPRLLAGGGVFGDARVMRTWGLHWDWLERDPDSGERNVPSNEKSGNLSGDFFDPAQTLRFLEKEKYRQHIVLEGLFLDSGVEFEPTTFMFRA